MRRKNISDYQAFIAVAREQSFTKAAAQLGVSQSALSYTVRTLEAHLGLRLLTRTTRSVAVTEAGERLLMRIGPHFDGIEQEIAAISGLRDKPAGLVRITAVEHALKRCSGQSWHRCCATIPISTLKSSAITGEKILWPSVLMRASGWVNRLIKT